MMSNPGLNLEGMFGGARPVPREYKPRSASCWFRLNLLDKKAYKPIEVDRLHDYVNKAASKLNLVPNIEKTSTKVTQFIEEMAGLSLGIGPGINISSEAIRQTLDHDFDSTDLSPLLDLNREALLVKYREFIGKTYKINPDLLVRHIDPMSRIVSTLNELNKTLVQQNSLLKKIKENTDMMAQQADKR